MPYPDDLDDTFAALIALRGLDPDILSGEVLACIAKLLTSTEAQEGGPYRTWLVKNQVDPAWQDVDLVVNSNISHFLSCLQIKLPHIESLVEGAIEQSFLVSPYYPGICHVAYFISRSYSGSRRELIGNILASYLEQNIVSRLERAMSISSFINLGSWDRVRPEDLLQVLGGDDDPWRPYAFCIDPSREGKRAYAGSSALTAAFCVEALVKYAKVMQQGPATTARPTKASIIHQEIKLMAQEQCKVPGPCLANELKTKIDSVHDERITLLASDFKEALGEKGRIIPEKIVSRLALANLYGWVAYRTYDNFLDREGDPRSLPPANFFLQKLVHIYNNLEHEVPGAWPLFERIMGLVEEANAWEQEHCRFHPDCGPPKQLPSFGNYENLGNRSIGHALGPLAELLVLGYDERSDESRAIESVFSHYLIARQLNDDAHDWADDLARGEINSVGAIVIARQMESSFGIVPQERWISSLQNLFWTKAIDDVEKLVFEHTHAAREARIGMHILKDKIFLEQELVAIEKATHRARHERDQALAFIEGYSVQREDR